MANYAGMKLGKHPARHDVRTLQMASYLRLEHFAVPPSENWGAKVSTWPMMKNDIIGDCTCAAAGHLIQEWTSNTGPEVIPSDKDIVDAYAAVSGYDPTNGKGDRGAAEIDVLNYWRQSGIAKHKIESYVALEPRNHHHIMAAVFLFGGCYIGLALPVSAQRQDVWSVPPTGAVGPGAPGSWGGHAVPVVAYDAHGLTVVTWGDRKRMTWTFWDTYCDEAYAVLSPDFLKDGKSVSGFDVEALKKDLQKIGA